MNTMTIERCPCGPLHYENPSDEAQIMALIRQFGPVVPVPASTCIYRVPRHWLALHGRPTPAEIHELAARYGWEQETA